MKKYYLPLLDLHMFEGSTSAAGAGEGGSQGDTQGGSANTQQSKTGDTQGGSVNTQQSKTGDLSSVKYGKVDDNGTDSAKSQPDVQAPAAEGAVQGVSVTSDTLEARQKEFDELINSDKYKDIYTKRTQEMINRRFTQTKSEETKNGKLREIADLLSQKYGIQDDGDFSKLKAAIDGDEDTWAKAADEAGMSIEQYKKFNALQKRNEAFEAAKQNDIREAQNRHKAETWMREAQELKTKFPQFDLKAELADRNFMAAINAGVPMETVYKGKYYDQFVESATQSAAQTTEKNLVDNIRAKGKRPSENGTASQSAAFTVKSDPSKLTLADFDEIAKRVMRGEKISF